jgi:hypothetical protein
VRQPFEPHQMAAFIWGQRRRTRAAQWLPR